MPWRKDRPRSPGEMEFHLTGLREMMGEHPRGIPDDKQIQRRLEKLRARHGSPSARESAKK